MSAMFLFLIRVCLINNNRTAFFLAQADTGSGLQDLRIFVDFVI